MRGVLFCACIAVSLGLSLGAFATEVSVSPTYLFDEIADGKQVVPIPEEKLISSLTHETLLSIGETHAGGQERTFLKDFYSKLAATKKIRPAKCLVENYELLLPNSPNDPVRPQFAKICPEKKVTNNQTDDYVVDLRTTNSTMVLTHTGLRHMLPFGLIYPKDFDSKQWVDIPEYGTITKQVPLNFSSYGTMKSHAVFNLHVETATYMRHRLNELLDQNYTAAAAITHIRADLIRFFQSPAFKFSDGETAKSFELRRVQRSFNFEKGYFTLLKDENFKPQAIIDDLASNAVGEFLKQADSKSILFEYYISLSKKTIRYIQSFQISESGTFYLYGASVTKPNSIVILAFSPTHGPSITTVENLKGGLDEFRQQLMDVAF